MSVFTGARVRALAWCPTTIHNQKKQHQFLAVVSDVTDSVNYEQNSCRAGESLLQLWNFKTDLYVCFLFIMKLLNLILIYAPIIFYYSARASCEYCLLLDVGCVSEIKFCPLRADNQQRLGLAALACSTGVVEIIR